MAANTRKPRGSGDVIGLFPSTHKRRLSLLCASLLRPPPSARAPRCRWPWRRRNRLTVFSSDLSSLSWRGTAVARLTCDRPHPPPFARQTLYDAVPKSEEDARELQRLTQLEIGSDYAGSDGERGGPAPAARDMPHYVPKEDIKPPQTIYEPDMSQGSEGITQVRLPLDGCNWRAH